MNIVILGPQGSGKGTQAELIAEKYNLLHVETGKILRDVANSDSPFAEEVKVTMLEGKLVSDKILETVISEALKTQGKNGFVFDGTPRDEQQYFLIKKILSDRGEKIDALIVIEISEAETIKRLTSRRTCKVCGNVYNTITNPSPSGSLCECKGELIQREDDFPISIKKRLQSYHEKTNYVILRAKDDGILYTINGERPIEVVFNEIADIIDTINAKNTGKN